MIPKIHKKGTSFIDATRYVMHDKKADTSERVEWAATVNLGTSNPHAAARVMAATAMDSARLKKEAGIPNTGRKSKQHVFHATLSWHAEEAEDLDREQMMSAAKWFLSKLGAEDRQALVVCHNDEPQPHVHILLNRVSSQDGRMLPSSLEKIKASEWAEKYERDRGKIYCDQRVINNKERARIAKSKHKHAHVRYEKDEPRFIAEMRQQAANENDRTRRKELEKKIQSEKEIAKSIGRRQGMLERQHRLQREDMQAAIEKRRQFLRDAQRLGVMKARQQVQGDFREEWETEYHEQQAQQAAFTLRENTFIGRMKNAIASVDWKELMLRQKGHTQGKAGTLGEAYNAFGDSEGRLQRLIIQQALRENEIQRRQNMAEQSAIEKFQAEHAKRIAAAHSQAQQELAQLEIRQMIERDRITKERQQLNRERRQTWESMLAENDLDRGNPKPQNARSQPQRHSGSISGVKPLERSREDSGASRANASDMLPKQGADQAAQQANSVKDKMRERLAKKQADRENDKGDTSY